MRVGRRPGMYWPRGSGMTLITSLRIDVAATRLLCEHLFKLHSQDWFASTSIATWSESYLF